MHTILSFVKSGLLFGIFASVILALCPNKTYQKHISMVVGMLFILIMLHPVLVLFHADTSLYDAYLRNFLMLETDSTGKDIVLYQDSVAMQLKQALTEAGYPVKEIKVEFSMQGEIKKIVLSFTGQVDNTEQLDVYFKQVFGEEVQIVYEWEE